MLQHRPDLLVVDLQAAPHLLGGVVLAAEKGGPVVGAAGALELAAVIGGLADRADESAGDTRDDGIVPSRLMLATPHDILRFTRRGTGRTDYLMLKAALDRLQSTTVATSIRQPAGKRLHRFSWINEWKEHVRPDGRCAGIELILADWFFCGVMDDALTA